MADNNVRQTSAATRPFFIGVCLALATFACYLPALHNGFLAWDDPQYILDNRHVNSGLSGQGLAWAFNIGYASNWHPLTWLSHMVDCSLFGLNPMGHHLTNLLLHLLATLLLFAFLFQATRGLWRSAAV